jgi:multidrug resistance efflux pump
MKPNYTFPIVLVFFCLISAGCSSAGKSTTPTPENGSTSESESVINATGVVVPEQWAALSPRSQGVVVEVLVSEGELVSDGQPLVRLDGQAGAQAAISAAQYELINAQRELDKLKENAGTEAARTQQAIANAMQAVDDAQKDVAKLAYRRASDDLITQTLDEIDMAKKQISRAEDAFKLVKNRPDGDSLKAEAELALVKARIYLDNRNSYLNWYMGVPDDIDAAKYRSALAVAQAELIRSQAEYSRRKDGPDLTLLAHAEARINLAKAQLLAAEETSSNLELRAPFDGVVCNLDVRVGEWITPGVAIIQLGDLSSLRVETTDLSEIDAARIHPQDQAAVTFDALPGVTTNGTVLWVASKSAKGSGVTYTTAILLDATPANLRWGMTAFVDIKVTR